MRNSKKILKTGVKIIAFALLCLIVTGILSELFEPPRATSRIAIHEMYTQESMDIALVGASRFRRCIDPAVLDEKLGVDTFVTSYGSQTPIDSYYMLREIYKSYTPELVVLDMSFNTFNIRETSPADVIIPEIKPSLDKYRYFFDSLPLNKYLGTLLPVFSSYAQNQLMADSFSVLDNVKTKHSDEYKNYDYSFGSNSVSTYMGKGFLANSKQLTDGRAGKMSTVKWLLEDVNPKKLDFYEKTIEMCKRNGSRVIIIDTPTPFAGMVSQKAYADYEEFTTEFAKKHDVPFYNLCYLKTEVFERRDSYFYDRKHASAIGAKAFSGVLAGFLRDCLNGTLRESDYLYASYEETMAANPIIFNTWLVYDEKAKTMIANAWHGTGVTPEFRFSYKLEKEDSYEVIQNYSVNKVFSVKDYRKGYIRIDCRRVGSEVKWEQYNELKFD